MALIKCSNCNQMISDKAKTCPNCGASQIEKNETQTNQENNHLNRNSKKNIIVPIMLLFIGIFIGFGIGFSVKNNDVNDNSGTEETTTTVIREEVVDDEGNSSDESKTAEKGGKEGTVNITVDGVKNVDWGSLDDGMKAISVNLTVENIDYQYSDTWDDINPYLLNETGKIRVTDMDGFTLEFYDISGPDNGEYQLSTNIAMGTKARVGAPFKVKSDCTSVMISIDGGEAKEYKIE